jgi:hypothetical protein
LTVPYFEAVFCAEHGVNDDLLSDWVRLAEEGFDESRFQRWLVCVHRPLGASAQSYEGRAVGAKPTSPRDVLLPPRLRCCYEAFMDRDTAVAQIRKACNGISVELMKINPAVSALGDKEAQDEIYRTVFELTKEVETIKKRLAKLERSDESRDL